ncbi:hypothetical protein [Mucilaginibacter sp.]
MLLLAHKICITLIQKNIKSVYVFYTIKEASNTLDNFEAGS